jgi:cell division protein FtsZ
VADDVLRQAVQGISDLVMLPGLINLDFADVRTTMLDAGDAILGIGMGVGEHRATLAAEKAVASPLLETSVEGARSMLLSITGGPDLSLIEASEAADVVRQAAHPEAEIIFGASVDEDMSEEVWITVIATRFDNAFSQRHRRERRSEPREPRRLDQDAVQRRERNHDHDPLAERRRALRRRQRARPARPPAHGAEVDREPGARRARVRPGRVGHAGSPDFAEKPARSGRVPADVPGAACLQTDQAF